jgi:trans-aconitate methyltransferase
MQPIRYIVEHLRGVPPTSAADVGCGAGCYDLVLLQHLHRKTDHFCCVDTSQQMVANKGPSHKTLHTRFRNSKVGCSESPLSSGTFEL